MRKNNKVKYTLAYLYDQLLVFNLRIQQLEETNNMIYQNLCLESIEDSVIIILKNSITYTNNKNFRTDFLYLKNQLKLKYIDNKVI